MPFMGTTNKDSENLTQAGIFIKDNGYLASKFFGLCASTNTTSMVTQEVLVQHLTMPWAAQPQIAILIAIAATYNMVMDLMLNFIETHWLKKYNIYISLKEKEAIKFILLAIVAAILISQGYYILPIGLLLFSASYIINFGLQLKLSETINKLFFTKENSGDASSKWLQGFKKIKIEINNIIEEIELNKNQLKLINVGCGLSLFYVAAVIGVFAKWVFPLIFAIESLAVVIPLMILTSLVLFAYGIIYGILSTQSWAALVQLDAELKRRYDGYGLISINSVKIFGKKIMTGIGTYMAIALFNIIFFVGNIFKIFTAADMKSKLEAFLSVIGFILLAAAEIAFLGIKLLQILIVIFIFPVFTAMHSTIESGGANVGGLFHSNGLGQFITYGAFIGYLPFIVKSCANTIMPESSKSKDYNPNDWSSLSNIWLKCLQTINALVNSGLANDGQLPEDQDELIKMSGSSAVSYTAGGMAIDNINSEQAKEQGTRSLTQYLWNSLTTTSKDNATNSSRQVAERRVVY